MSQPAFELNIFSNHNLTLLALSILSRILNPSVVQQFGNKPVDTGAQAIRMTMSIVPIIKAKMGIVSAVKATIGIVPESGAKIDIVPA